MDRRTAGWLALAAAGAAMEAEALRGADGTLTCCVRRLVGPRLGVRWWLGVGLWCWAGGHFLGGWPV